MHAEDMKLSKCVGDITSKILLKFGALTMHTWLDITLERAKNTHFVWFGALLISRDLMMINLNPFRFELTRC